MDWFSLRSHVNRSHECPRFGHGETTSQPGFDLGLLAMNRGLDQLVGVLRGEMSSDERYRREVKPSLRNQLEERWKPSRRASRSDSPVGRILGKTKLLDAVGVHRRISGGGVESPSVDFGDVRE